MCNSDSATTPEIRHTSKFFLIGSIIGVCCLVGFILIWMVFAFPEKQHKQDIRALLEQRADALAQKDLPRYLSCFSQTYRSGQIRYGDLREHASRWFAQFATIRFDFRIIEIKLHGHTAIVENEYKFTLINFDGESINIAKRELLDIKREDDEWKIASSLPVQ